MRYKGYGLFKMETLEEGGKSCWNVFDPKENYLATLPTLRAAKQYVRDLRDTDTYDNGRPVPEDKIDCGY